MGRTRYSGPIKSTGGFEVGAASSGMTAETNTEVISSSGEIYGKAKLKTVSSNTTLAGSDSGKLMVLNVASGATVTLPASSGSGNHYRFFVATTVTSNNYKIQVANSSDVMAGVALFGQDAASTVVLFETAATSDTITLNGSTTGGIKGDFIELIDVATNLWSVKVVGSATGTEATPFSAAV